jgi:hypothetical protein
MSPADLPISVDERPCSPTAPGPQSDPLVTTTRTNGSAPPSANRDEQRLADLTA